MEAVDWHPPCTTSTVKAGRCGDITPQRKGNFVKEGLTLSQLAAEIERQNAVKRDFAADTRKVSVTEDMKQVVLANGKPENAQSFGISAYAHDQLAERLKLYRRDYQRLAQDHPDLLAPLVNGLLHREPKEAMLRVLDGKVRAVVSNRYRRLDNFDLAKAVLPVLSEIPDLRVESTNFTETRLYIKAVFPMVQAEVKVGDVVQAGIVVSNSEVGDGRVSVEPLVFRLICLNGLIVPDYGLKQQHVGRKHDTLDDSYELYTDETRQLDDAAFWSKVVDTVRAMSKPEVFEGIVAKLRSATRDKITAPVQDVVELVGKRNGYTEGTQAGILQHLIAGGDLSRYGLLNAVTRQSQDEESYESATQLEKDGGRILELAPTDWKRIAERVTH
jgi:hypothetical protein